MKVRELIEKLKELNQDRDIMFDADGYYSLTEIDEIIEEDYMREKVYVMK